jgi:hypothetical protein
VTTTLGASTSIEPWPELPWREWTPTIETLHRWTQIVGKLRLALAPPLNHWWHVALQASAHGLTTSPIPYDGREFQVDLDFVDHELRVTDGNPGSFRLALEPMSVATFYRRFMAGLHGRGIDVQIWPRPVEVADARRFDEDEEHASYDTSHVERFWSGLVRADRVMKEFQTGFVGKASPVHFFWGGFDHSTSRYSGRGAPRHRGGVVNCPDWVMEEAESRENVTVGWWPLSEAPGPAFYAYAYPEPVGFRAAQAQPAGAVFDERFGEYLLPYDAVRTASDPDHAVMEFLRSVYVIGASLGEWDRRVLEPAHEPGRRPKQGWSMLPPAGNAPNR